MKVIVTCGPSYEPIDEVRRLTNFSTGELGVLLSNHLARAGHAVRTHAADAARGEQPLPIVGGTRDEQRAERVGDGVVGLDDEDVVIGAALRLRRREALEGQGERDDVVGLGEALVPEPKAVGSTSRTD